MTQNRARKQTQSRPTQKKTEPQPTKKEEPPVTPPEEEQKQGGTPETQQADLTPVQGDSGVSGQGTPPEPADGQGDGSGDGQQTDPGDDDTSKDADERQDDEEPDIADRIPEPHVDTDPKENVGDIEPSDKPSKDRKAPDGVIIEAGEPIRIEGTLIGDQVLVTRNHYRKVIPYRSLRATYTLVYTKGTMIPKNLLVNLSEGDDKENKDSISGEVKK